MRRIRPAAVVIGCALAAVAAAALVGWRQRDFWRESTAHYIRERLAADFGAEFQAADLRGRWFPPALSFGRMTLHRRGQPWVLTAEDVRVTFNLYAILFRRERLGKVVLVRPHLFVRESAGTRGDAPGADAGARAGARAAGEALLAFLRPPLPVRAIEIDEGRLDVRDRAGRLYRADRVDLLLVAGGGRARVSIAAGSVSADLGGRRADLGRVSAECTIEEKLLRFGELRIEGGVLEGVLSGTADYAGTLGLEGALDLQIDQAAALIAPGRSVGGTAHFSGKVTGRWNDPQAAGTLGLRNPSLKGRRWPGGEASVTWAGRRLAWTGLRIPVGEGEILGSGEVDLSGGTPRFRLDAEARALELSWLPIDSGSFPARVRRLGGSLRWAGEGFGAAASGNGTLAARGEIAGWPGEQIALTAAVRQGGGALEATAFSAEARSLAASGSGVWRPGQGFSGTTVGTVADLGRLFALPGLSGRGRFEGALAIDAAGSSFDGRAGFEEAAYGGVSGAGGEARILVSPASVRIAEGRFAWPGGAGGVSGEIELPTGRLQLVTVLERLSLAEAARLLQADGSLFAGTLAATASWRGTLKEPEVSGQVRGGPVRFRALAADSASLAFRYAARLLAVTELKVARGSTSLSFRGEVRDGRTVAGDFEGAAFDLRDFLPDSGLELAGSFSGRVEGPVRAPSLKGRLRAGRLRYSGWDFKGGLLDVEYRDGTAVLSGWVIDEANRVRAVAEPAAGWRFAADLDLLQFRPEMVRSGIGSLPAGLRNALERSEFLAAGRVKLAGSLRDPATFRGDLAFDTLWVQIAGKALQNQAPVRISWKEGGFTVEQFRLAGDQYRLELHGKGSAADGWDLTAEGTLNLALFRDYWGELEEVDGLGDVQLALRGPWQQPLPEGSVAVRGGFIKARSLPEPLEGVAGRVELHGRRVSAQGLSGTIGEGTFTGRGSYDFTEGRLDAAVEGRLDLALFRGRIAAARELRGAADVRLTLQGPLDAIALAGDADVVDAELFVRGLPAKITRLRGSVRVAGDRIEVRGLTGQAGGGTLRLSGELDWRRTPARVDFDLEADGILLSLEGAVKAQCDLRLGLHGDFAALRLSGDVRLLKGRYLREFGEKPPALAPAAAAANGGGGAREAGLPDIGKIALDVRIRALDNVWIANKMAKIEAAVTLDLGGTVAEPVLRGEITGIRGEAFFLSRKFRLESGALRFAPPAKVPAIEVQASTDVGDVQVLFLMDGPLNKLSFHLTSLPPMTQEDLVALLTIGETRGDLGKRGERASAMEAALLGSEPLVNALGDQARRAVGVEVLQVEPIVGDGQEVTARVTVGTHLSDRLFVSYSQNLGATEDQQVSVEYFLLDSLALWGQELRQGIYSLDLVFRYAFH